MGVPGWVPADLFLSGVARDVKAGSSPRSLVADAAARTGDGARRGGVASRGEEDDAAAELERLARVLRALGQSPGTPRARRLRIRKTTRRGGTTKGFRALRFERGRGPGVRDAVACALGLQ